MIPSISNLVVFECAARHANFSRAADELHLTQGAVSRQIASLEGGLGIRLFERTKKRVVLTDAGRLYLDDVRKTLRDLNDATYRAMRFRRSRDILNLATLPTFGTRWLIPRLTAFHEIHPSIVIDFSSRLRPFDFESEPFDAAIHHGEPVWAGSVVEHLMDEEMVVACSPKLCADPSSCTPQAISKLMLLHIGTRLNLWADWFSAHGVQMDDVYAGPKFEHFGMIAAAASAGLGVALIPRFLIEEELTTGKLVIAGPWITVDRAYYLVYPQHKAHLHAVHCFREWILQEAQAQRTLEGRS